MAFELMDSILAAYMDGSLGLQLEVQKVKTGVVTRYSSPTQTDPIGNCKFPHMETLDAGP